MGSRLSYSNLRSPLANKLPIHLLGDLPTQSVLYMHYQLNWITEAGLGGIT